MEKIKIKYFDDEIDKIEKISNPDEHNAEEYASDRVEGPKPYI